MQFLDQRLLKFLNPQVEGKSDCVLLCRSQCCLLFVDVFLYESIEVLLC